jgi:hypothetical protein
MKKKPRMPPIGSGAKSTMATDYRSIRYGRDYRRVIPENFYEAHRNTKTFIFKHAKRDHPEQKVIVVTHMAPSYGSVNCQYHTYDDLMTNFFYFSNLEDRIKQDGQEIDFWFHGHTHNFCNYVLDGHLRVICNPRGYFQELGTGFQPLLRIDLDEPQLT